MPAAISPQKYQNRWLEYPSFTPYQAPSRATPPKSDPDATYVSGIPPSPTSRHSPENICAETASTGTEDLTVGANDAADAADGAARFSARTISTGRSTRPESQTA